MRHGFKVRLALFLALAVFATFILDVPSCLALWDSATFLDSSANIVVNGSFEAGPDPGLYLPLSPGSTAITGWMVTRGQIDYVGVWQDFEGDRSVDLDGTPGFGGIAQTLPTTPGAVYSVTFAMAGNSHGPPEPKRMQVNAAGQSAVFSFDATGTTYDSMAWERKSWSFIASGTTAVLEFFSLDTVDGTYGPALDSVSVRATSSSGFRIPLIVASGSKVDTLVFGRDPDATFCIDASLGEIEVAPPPPSGVFDARFIQPNNADANLCFHNGVVLDLRPVVSADADTFRVRFQPGPAGYPMTFRWAPLQGSYGGSVRLVDGFGGLIVNVNMKQDSSYALANPIVGILNIIADPLPPPPDPLAEYRIPLLVRNGIRAETLLFGVDSGATYCLDAALGERELPPPPPAGVFDVRFIQPNLYDPAPCFQAGTDVDLRPRVGAAQLDTFRLMFQPGSAGYPIEFSWAPVQGIVGGPVRLVDDITGFIVNVDMREDTSYALTNPLIRRLLIIAGGAADTSSPPLLGSYRTFSQLDYAARARRLRSGMVPTAANVRDETYQRMGWFTSGLYVGIPMPDSTTFYGWVYFRRNVVRLPRFLPHTGPARGFDTYIAGKAWHYSRANPAVKYHDNHLAGEQFILKFNVGASDLGITPTGFGDLVFGDTVQSTSAFNGLTIRQIMVHTDSALTFCKRYPSSHFAELDSCLTKINRAFVGPITGYTVSPLTMEGARELAFVPYLHPNPSPQPVILPSPRIEPPSELPAVYALHQNYPNPFNPATVIEFDLPEASNVTLKVFNTLGQEVAVILGDLRLDEGRQSFEFDASGLPSGMYFCRLEYAGDEGPDAHGALVRKMILMK